MKLSKGQIGLFAFVVGVFYKLIDHKILEQTAPQEMSGKLFYGLYTKREQASPVS